MAALEDVRTLCATIRGTKVTHRRAAVKELLHLLEGNADVLRVLDAETRALSPGAKKDVSTRSWPGVCLALVECVKLELDATADKKKGLDAALLKAVKIAFAGAHARLRPGDRQPLEVCATTLIRQLTAMLALGPRCPPAVAAELTAVLQRWLLPRAAYASRCKRRDVVALIAMALRRCAESVAADVPRVDESAKSAEVLRLIVRTAGGDLPVSSLDSLTTFYGDYGDVLAGCPKAASPAQGALATLVRTCGRDMNAGAVHALVRGAVSQCWRAGPRGAKPSLVGYYRAALKLGALSPPKPAGYGDGDHGVDDVYSATAGGDASGDWDDDDDKDDDEGNDGGGGNGHAPTAPSAPPPLRELVALVEREVGEPPAAAQGSLGDAHLAPQLRSLCELAAAAFAESDAADAAAEAALAAAGDGGGGEAGPTAKRHKGPPPALIRALNGACRGIGCWPPVLAMAARRYVGRGLTQTTLLAWLGALGMVLAAAADARMGPTPAGGDMSSSAVVGGTALVAPGVPATPCAPQDVSTRGTQYPSTIPPSTIRAPPPIEGTTPTIGSESLVWAIRAARELAASWPIGTPPPGGSSAQQSIVTGGGVPRAAAAAAAVAAWDGASRDSWSALWSSAVRLSHLVGRGPAAQAATSASGELLLLLAVCASRSLCRVCPLPASWWAPGVSGALDRTRPPTRPALEALAACAACHESFDAPVAAAGGPAAVASLRADLMSWVLRAIAPPAAAVSLYTAKAPPGVPDAPLVARALLATASGVATGRCLSGPGAAAGRWWRTAPPPGEAEVEDDDAQVALNALALGGNSDDDDDPSESDDGSDDGEEAELRRLGTSSLCYLRPREERSRAMQRGVGPGRAGALGGDIRVTTADPAWDGESDTSQESVVADAAAAKAGVGGGLATTSGALPGGGLGGGDGPSIASRQLLAGAAIQLAERMGDPANDAPQLLLLAAVAARVARVLCPTYPSTSIPEWGPNGVALTAAADALSRVVELWQHGGSPAARLTRPETGAALGALVAAVAPTRGVGDTTGDDVDHNTGCGHVTAEAGDASGGDSDRVDPPTAAARRPHATTAHQMRLRRFLRDQSRREGPLSPTLDALPPILEAAVARAAQRAAALRPTGGRVGAAALAADAAAYESAVDAMNWDAADAATTPWPGEGADGGDGALDGGAGDGDEWAADDDDGFGGGRWAPPAPAADAVTVGTTTHAVGEATQAVTAAAIAGVGESVDGAAALRLLCACGRSRPSSTCRSLQRLLARPLHPGNGAGGEPLLPMALRRQAIVALCSLCGRAGAASDAAAAAVVAVGAIRRELEDDAAPRAAVWAAKALAALAGSIAPRRGGHGGDDDDPPHSPEAAAQPGGTTAARAAACAAALDAGILSALGETSTRCEVTVGARPRLALASAQAAIMRLCVAASTTSGDGGDDDDGGDAQTAARGLAQQITARLGDACGILRDAAAGGGSAGALAAFEAFPGYEASLLEAALDPTAWGALQLPSPGAAPPPGGQAGAAAAAARGEASLRFVARLALCRASLEPRCVYLLTRTAAMAPHHRPLASSLLTAHARAVGYASPARQRLIKALLPSLAHAWAADGVGITALVRSRRLLTPHGLPTGGTPGNAFLLAWARQLLPSLLLSQTTGAPGAASAAVDALATRLGVTPRDLYSANLTHIVARLLPLTRAGCPTMAARAGAALEGGLLSSSLPPDHRTGHLKPHKTALRAVLDMLALVTPGRLAEEGDDPPGATSGLRDTPAAPSNSDGGDGGGGIPAVDPSPSLEDALPYLPRAAVVAASRDVLAAAGAGEADTQGDRGGFPLMSARTAMRVLGEIHAALADGRPPRHAHRPLASLRAAIDLLWSSHPQPPPPLTTPLRPPRDHTCPFEPLVVRYAAGLALGALARSQALQRPAAGALLALLRPLLVMLADADRGGAVSGGTGVTPRRGGNAPGAAASSHGSAGDNNGVTGGFAALDADALAAARATVGAILPGTVSRVVAAIESLLASHPRLGAPGERVATTPGGVRRTSRLVSLVSITEALVTQSPPGLRPALMRLEPLPRRWAPLRPAARAQSESCATLPLPAALHLLADRLAGDAAVWRGGATGGGIARWQHAARERAVRSLRCRVARTVATAAGAGHALSPFGAVRGPDALAVASAARRLLLLLPPPGGSPAGDLCQLVGDLLAACGPATTAVPPPGASELLADDADDAADAGGEGGATPAGGGHASSLGRPPPAEEPCPASPAAVCPSGQLPRALLRLLVTCTFESDPRLATAAQHTLGWVLMTEEALAATQAVPPRPDQDGGSDGAGSQPPPFARLSTLELACLRPYLPKPLFRTQPQIKEQVDAALAAAADAARADATSLGVRALRGAAFDDPRLASPAAAGGYPEWVKLLAARVLDHAQTPLLTLCQVMARRHAAVAELLLPHALEDLATPTTAADKQLRAQLTPLITALLQPPSGEHVPPAAAAAAASARGLTLRCLEHLRRRHLYDVVEFGLRVPVGPPAVRGALLRGMSAPGGCSAATWASPYWVDVDALTVAQAALAHGAPCLALLAAELAAEAAAGGGPPSLPAADPTLSAAPLPPLERLLLSAHGALSSSEPDGIYGVARHNHPVAQLRLHAAAGDWPQALRAADTLLRAGGCGEPRGMLEGSALRALQHTGCLHVLTTYAHGLHTAGAGGGVDAGNDGHVVGATVSEDDGLGDGSGGDWAEMQHEAAWRMRAWGGAGKGEAVPHPRGGALPSLGYHAAVDAGLAALERGDAVALDAALASGRAGLVRRLARSSLESPADVAPAAVRLSTLSEVADCWRLRWGMGAGDPLHPAMLSPARPLTPSFVALPSAVVPTDDALASATGAQWAAAEVRLARRPALRSPLLAVRAAALRALGRGDVAGGVRVREAAAARQAGDLGRCSEALSALTVVAPTTTGRAVALGRAVLPSSGVDVRVEEARMLWATEQQELAVRLASHLLASCRPRPPPPPPWGDADRAAAAQSVAYARLQSRTATWLAESRQAGPQEVLGHMADAADAAATTASAADAAAADDEAAGHAAAAAADRALSSRAIAAGGRAQLRLAEFADAQHRAAADRAASPDGRAEERQRAKRELLLSDTNHRLRAETEAYNADFHTFEAREKAVAAGDAAAKRWAATSRASEISALEERRATITRETGEAHNLAKLVRLDGRAAATASDRTTSLLHIALRSYCGALRAVGPPAEVPAVFRLCALWLRRAEDPSSHFSGFADTLLSVPSHKFLPLVYQLASRLTSPSDRGPLRSSGFAPLLEALLSRVAACHPHHAVYQLLALQHGGRRSVALRTGGSAAGADPDKAAAASALLTGLRKTVPRLCPLLDEMEAAVEDYLRIAEQPCPADRDGNPRPPSGLPPEVRKARFTSLAVPSLVIPVDPSGVYPVGSYPTMSRFVEGIRLVGGITVPKLIEVRATDGRQYKQLVKAGSDDLRQDAVMEQLFGLVNVLLAAGAATRARSLRVRTYKVVPFTPWAGLVEWVEGAAPLRSYLLGERSTKPGAHARHGAGGWTVAQVRDHLGKAKDDGGKSSRGCYDEACANFPPVMRHFFTERYPAPATWFARRTAYTRSVAVASMVGAVIGLGDRHLVNILIDGSTAEVVHIDMGVCFEQGALLNTPELVPFRLTRDVVDGMGATGVEGAFRRCCVAALAVLRAHGDAVLTLVEVFLHDPLYKWAMTPTKARLRQHEDDARAAGPGAGGAASTGATPSAAGGSAAMAAAAAAAAALGGGDDDETGGNAQAERALQKVRHKLAGYDGAAVRSVAGQVQQLIQEAADPDKLHRMYIGWAAYC